MKNEKSTKKYITDNRLKQAGWNFSNRANRDNIFFWDLENYRPIKYIGLSTMDDLESFENIRRNLIPLAAELINTITVERNLQFRATRYLMEDIDRKKSVFLIVIMANGIGKTRTTYAMDDSLMRAGWVKRVLFLFDHIELSYKALEVKKHLPNQLSWLRNSKKSFVIDKRINTSTYLRMINIIRDEKYSLTPHFFDLIVVNESHRSFYNNYEEAVNRNIPNYLCDFQAMNTYTKFQGEGISKKNTITKFSELPLSINLVI